MLIYNPKSLKLIHTSLFKCCFFYLIWYHRANVISINRSIMLKARKITVLCCSVHDPGTDHRCWRWTPKGRESANTGPTSCQEKKILRDSWKFSCTWRLISFSSFVLREHNEDQLNSIQQAVIDPRLNFRRWAWGLELNGKRRHSICLHSKIVESSWKNKHITPCQRLLKPLRWISKSLF